MSVRKFSFYGVSHNRERGREAAGTERHTTISGWIKCLSIHPFVYTTTIICTNLIDHLQSTTTQALSSLNENNPHLANWQPVGMQIIYDNHTTGVVHGRRDVKAVGGGTDGVD